MSCGLVRNLWDSHPLVNGLIGGAAGALATIAPEGLTQAQAVPVIGGLLVGATFLTVFQLSHRFLERHGMDSRRMESRWARAAVFLSRLALAVLAAGCASFIVGTLAGYTFTAWEIASVGCCALLAKMLFVDPMIRGHMARQRLQVNNNEPLLRAEPLIA